MSFRLAGHTIALKGAVLAASRDLFQLVIAQGQAAEIIKKLFLFGLSQDHWA